MNTEEFIELRNKTIYLLHTQATLRPTDISNLQVQHISDDFLLIRLMRGNRIFRVALSPQLSENLKLLCYNRHFKDNVIYSQDNPTRGISRTMISKIIDKMNGKSVVTFNFGSKLREETIDACYHVRQIYDKFVVCYDNRPMSGLSMRVKDHAEQIANILNLEMRERKCIGN